MVQNLKYIANETRKDILFMGYILGGSSVHIGGCMSIVELLTVLYQNHLSIDKNHPNWECRDRIIMSKGHGSLAMYAAMHQTGIIDDIKNIKELLGPKTIYYKQCVRNPEKGIEFSSGSLGQGLAYGIGIAWALKLKKLVSPRIYIFIGDGECDEGAVWEAASIAGHHKLDNITVVVDRNHLQIDGNTENINSMANLKERWEVFGFDVMEINGHDVIAVDRAYSYNPSGRPVAIIANTIKGKGISFAENSVEWHQNILTHDLYEKAMEELRSNLLV